MYLYNSTRALDLLLGNLLTGPRRRWIRCFSINSQADYTCSRRSSLSPHQSRPILILNPSSSCLLFSTERAPLLSYSSVLSASPRRSRDTMMMFAHRPPNIIISAFLVPLLLLLPTSTTAIRLPFLDDLSLPHHFWSPQSGGPALHLVAPPVASPPSLPAAPAAGPRQKSHAAQVNKRYRPSELLHPSTSSNSTSRASNSPKPARRDINTVPDTWFIQRAYQGESFFKYVVPSFSDASNLVSLSEGHSPCF